MASTYYTQHSFDFLEIISELELPYKKYQPLKPLKTGQSIPGFALKKEFNNWRQFFNGSQVHGPVVLRQLLNKPLVISFYSAHWGESGTVRLKQLNAIQHEIRAAGANLLIITPDEDSKAFENMIWDNSLSLSFYYDEENVIAQKLKLFSEASPVWNTYSGIDVNVPLLATYVLDTNNQILYDEVDNELNGTIPSPQILDALHSSSLYQTTRKSA
ncbi:redoxin domain-containing protein [Mucilaginibacter psychrotolerans]|uniref:Redoxin domain-containing protein n=1 Tax=Mucilaginibacter psychrotolerans TaxID=1524096 RepID=A0A4Y8SKJ7_9SPHI|nr:redoxin domain-containing protein [Mucilaginibacter psychrotolerans]TFF38896.1 redoxin domain-containing protein [Mucilaginibacter psychrotolerans]